MARGDFVTVALSEDYFWSEPHKVFRIVRVRHIPDSPHVVEIALTTTGGKLPSKTHKYVKIAYAAADELDQMFVVCYVKNEYLKTTPRIVFTRR